MEQKVVYNFCLSLNPKEELSLYSFECLDRDSISKMSTAKMQGVLYLC